MAAIPFLLGFVPCESVVAVSLRGVRGQVGLTMRLDLVDEARDDEVAAVLAGGMARDQATDAVVVVFTDTGDSDHGLPRRRLAEAVHKAMPVPVRELLLVRRARWWSYRCQDAACCPREGRPVDTASSGALAVAAAHALTGRAVLADRAAVLASIAPVTGSAERSMYEAIERAGDTYASIGGRRYAARACGLIARLLDRFDNLPATVTDDEAACCIVAMHDVGVRDELLGWAGERPAAAYALLLCLAPRALPPLDAPACAALACCAYADGDGVIAAGALERCLASDPEYSLALLLRSALDQQVHPGQLRDAVRQAWVSGGAANPPW